MSEEWRDIPGFNGIFQASNLGRIKSLPRPVQNPYKRPTRKVRILCTKLDKRGYPVTRLCLNGKRTSHSVHRLVAAAFYGPSKLTVNHINEIKTDNRPENLEYVSNRINVIHSLMNRPKLTGVIKSGKRWQAKISINNDKVHLGTFDTPEEASVAYQNKIKEIEGVNYGRR